MIARLIDNVLRFLVCRIHRRAIVVLSLLPPTCGGLLFEPGRLASGRDLTFFRVRLSSADQLGADTTLSDGWRAILVRVVHRGRGGEGMMLFRVFKNH